MTIGALIVKGQLRTAAATESSLWEPSTHADPLPIIWPLLGRHIAFHRRLVDLTDSVKAALLLSQSIYWTRRGRDIARNGGWFHKTTEQWTWETGLSPKEQRIARDALKKLNGVSEDDVKHAEKDLQKVHDDYIGKVDAMIKAKEAEIMEV